MVGVLRWSTASWPIYFKKGVGIYGYCRVKREEYSKREQRMIDVDIKKYRFTYRKGYYFDQIKKTRQKAPKSVSEVFLETKVYKQRKEDTPKISGRYKS